MPILDSYGNPVSSNWKYVNAANRYTRDRPWEPLALSDISKLIPSYDRQTILSVSRRLYANMPIAQGAIDQKAFYAVGRAWSPAYMGEDVDFGAAAQDFLLSQWYPTCNVRGPSHDFLTSLYVMSLCVDRDGEAFVLLTQTESGYPQIQLIPAHRVGQRDANEETVKSGPYRGLPIVDGVIMNRQFRPVAYRVLDDDEEKDQDISARNLIHVYDVQYPEQVRGLPAFTASLNFLRDSLTSHQWEQMALLMLSKFGIIEYNELGGPDLNDPRNALVPGASANSGMVYESMAQGMVQYFRSNSGSKIETVQHDRPGDAWESFQDRNIRYALAGINWPYSLAWKPEGNGTVTREELVKAQKAIDDRQDLLDSVASRIITYVIAKRREQLGPLPRDWYRWKFQKPAKITIDDGRTGRTWVEMWRSGLVNESEYLSAKGISLDEHLRERAAEAAKRELARREAEAKYQVPIDPREMAMFTVTEQTQEQQNASGNSSNLGN